MTSNDAKEMLTLSGITVDSLEDHIEKQWDRHGFVNGDELFDWLVKKLTDEPDLVDFDEEER